MIYTDWLGIHTASKHQNRIDEHPDSSYVCSRGLDEFWHAAISCTQDLLPETYVLLVKVTQCSPCCTVQRLNVSLASLILTYPMAVHWTNHWWSGIHLWDSLPVIPWCWLCCMVLGGTSISTSVRWAVRRTSPPQLTIFGLGSGRVGSPDNQHELFDCQKQKWEKGDLSLLVLAQIHQQHSISWLLANTPTSVSKIWRHEQHICWYSVPGIIARHVSTMNHRI